MLQVLWGLGFGLIAPIQPLYLASLGAEPAQIGLVFGIGNIAGGLLILPAGLAADRWGRRLVIVGSGITGTLGALVLVLLTHWEPLERDRRPVGGVGSNVSRITAKEHALGSQTRPRKSRNQFSAHSSAVRPTRSARPHSVG